MSFTDFASRQRPSSLIAAAVLALTAFSTDVRAASFDTLYGFPSDKRGESPIGSMVRDANGVLYGVTREGGAGCTIGCGLVYQLKPTNSGPWLQKIIHKFASTGTDGATPIGGLIMGPDGTLYGTTIMGGSLHGGTVYALTPPPPGQSDWTFELLHEFDASSTNDSKPYGNLMLGQDGALYGMNGGNGAGNSGTIFRLKHTGSGWAYKALYHFSEDVNATYGLVEDAQGRLYGIGGLGGTNDLGVLFRLSPPAQAGDPWIYKVLHNFSSDPADAMSPQGTLVLRDGVLYGQAYSNVSSGSLVFRLDLPATFEVIHRMKAATQGSGAGSGLAFDDAGVIYGVNFSEGPGGQGTLFKLAPPTSGGWQFRLLHAFTGSPDGAGPFSTPLLDEDGNIYVNTLGGGDIDGGGVFVYRP